MRTYVAQWRETRGLKIRTHEAVYEANSKEEAVEYFQKEKQYRKKNNMSPMISLTVSLFKPHNFLEGFYKKPLDKITVLGEKRGKQTFLIYFTDDTKRIAYINFDEKIVTDFWTEEQYDI